ncbi:mannitol dehydrogenase family protein [Actinophytocola sp.]|uniref:mannitol dehydrogenase family protein n=1 Tax=Actinophytocola sp. TaxID=1872138 RepID=UPI0025BBE979|nr:mannitol dehydrogenase family protein [Actinophytocola sp.]
MSRASYAGDLPKAGTGIVHLGLGAFHRAHQAVLTQEAMLAEPGDWAICAVGQRSGAVRDALAAQDCLFTVAERDAEGERLRVVGSIQEVLLATTQPHRLATILSDVDIRVVTITVTESGYRHDPATGRLRAADPEVASDLTGRSPGTVIGQLVGGLRRRRHRGHGGLTVLSCDNLPDNGTLVAGLVREFCLLGHETALADWVAEHVRFPSTVVDQIVPATTGADLAAVAEGLGLEDRAAVVGEPYRQWVIEDDFAAGRPAWDRAGATLVTDIAPHQAAKLRLVNGTHSALAYLGMLAGCSSTAEVAGRDELAAYASRLMIEETGASLARFGLVVGDREVQTLLGRLRNPRITHRLAQIGADGPRKLPQRLLAPAEELLASGREPRLICLALAGFLRHQGLSELDFLPASLRGSVVFLELLAEATDRLVADGVTATVRRMAEEASHGPA